MNRDVEQMLNELGSTPVPPPSQSFADNLESDLRVLVASSTAGPGATRFGRWPATVAALGFTAAVIVFALVTLSNGPTEIYIGTVSDAEVILPTGERFAASPGVALPPGALVVTGDEGSVTIGDTVYGPNSNVFVDGDDVEEVDDIAAIVERLPQPTVPEPTLATSRSDDVAGGSSAAAGTVTSNSAPTTTLVSTSTTVKATTSVQTTLPSSTTEPPVNVTPLPTTAPPTTTTLATTTTSAVSTTVPATTVPVGSATSTTTSAPGSDTSTTTTAPGSGSTTTTSTTTSTTEPGDTTTTTSTSTTTTEVKVDPASAGNPDVDQKDPPAVISTRDPLTGRIIGEILDRTWIIVNMSPE